MLKRIGVRNATPIFGAAAATEITLPDGAYARIIAIQMQVSTSAVVGNRTFEFLIRDNNPTYPQTHVVARTPLAANKLVQIDTYPGAAVEVYAGAAWTTVGVPFTPIMVPPLTKVLPFDLQAIDAAGDVMTFGLDYEIWIDVAEQPTVINPTLVVPSPTISG